MQFRGEIDGRSFPSAPLFPPLHNLAKVGVAGSNPVVRSDETAVRGHRLTIRALEGPQK